MGPKILRLLLLLPALGAVIALLALPPLQSAHAAGVAAIAAGGLHTCALTAEGGVKCWGDNFFAALGDGTQGQRHAPTDVLTAPGGPPLRGVTALALGQYHSCALTEGGAVKCWGYNLFGQLGIPPDTRCPDPVFGGTFPCSTVPADVTGLEGDVVAIGAGYAHTCAALSAGGLKCWGWNSLGQLGDGTTITRFSAVDVCQDYDDDARQCRALLTDAATMAGGYDHTCALTTGGGAKCWGSNASGELGTEADELCPDPFLGNLQPCSTIPLDVFGLTSGVTAVTAGIGHGCALMTSTRVRCWGANAAGQLGNGTHTNSPIPSDVVAYPEGPPLSAVTAVAAGSFSRHTCALTSMGGAQCWGENFSGQLGDGTTVASRLTPSNVCEEYDAVLQRCQRAIGDLAAIAVGSSHTCALTAWSSVKCWGNNGAGRLGIGSSDSDDHPTPLDVLGLAPKVTPTPTQTPTRPSQAATPTATGAPPASPTASPVTTPPQASPTTAMPATPAVSALPQSGRDGTGGDNSMTRWLLAAAGGAGASVGAYALRRRARKQVPP